MEDIVQEALDRAETEQTNTASDAVRGFGDPEMVVIGCGEYGIKTVEKVADKVPAVNTIAVTTEDNPDDSQPATEFSFNLNDSIIHRGLQLEPSTDRRWLQESNVFRRMTDVLMDADLCFITGRVSTHDLVAATNITALAVDDSSAIGIGLLTAESESHSGDTTVSIDQLYATLDLVTLIDPQEIQSPSLFKNPTNEAGHLSTAPESLFSRFVVNAVRTIIDPSTINLDYADLTSIATSGEVGTLAAAVSKNVHVDPTDGQKVINNPLYPIDLEEVTGCWICLVSGPQLTLKQAETLSQAISNHPNLSGEPGVVWSAHIIDNLEDEVQIYTLLTGVQGNDHSTITLTR